MPTPPYASALVSLNGGGNQSGGIAGSVGDVAQLHLGSTQAFNLQRWDLVSVPPGYPAPASWLTDTDGTFYSLAATPPPFSLSVWGKFAVRLRVGDALTNKDAAGKLTDVTLCIDVVSPGGLHDLARGESNQFGTDWTVHQKLNLRAIEAGLGGGGGGGGSLPALGAANTVLRVNASHTAIEYALLSDANIATGAAIAPAKVAAGGTANRVLLTTDGVTTSWGQIAAAMIAAVAWASVTGAPTTLAGYGITDAAASARTLTAGAGLTGGGDLTANRTFAVGANGDGSIVVNADDVQVGVLASDAQHGNRGGGALHAAVSNAANGFAPAITAANRVLLSTNGTSSAWGQIVDAMVSSVGWSKLTGLPTTLAGYGITDAVPAARTITTTAPLTIGGGGSADLSANRTLAVANATTGAVGVLQLAGDLAGTGTSPTVVGLTGASGTVAMHGTALLWDQGTSGATLKQAQRTGDNAALTLSVVAQAASSTATSTNRNGATLLLQGGDPAAAAANYGGVTIGSVGTSGGQVGGDTATTLYGDRAALTVKGQHFTSASTSFGQVPLNLVAAGSTSLNNWVQYSKTDGTWHAFAGIQNGSVMQFLANTSEIGSIEFGFASSGNPNLYVGATMVLDHSQLFVSGELRVRPGATAFLVVDANGVGVNGNVPIATPAAYTITNHVARRTMDENAITLVQLANFVGTMAKDFGAASVGAAGYGFLQ